MLLSQYGRQDFQIARHWAGQEYQIAFKDDGWSKPITIFIGDNDRIQGFYGQEPMERHSDGQWERLSCAASDGAVAECRFRMFDKNELRLDWVRMHKWV